MGLIYISTNIVSTQDYHHLEDYHHLGGYHHLDHQIGQTTQLDWWNAPLSLLHKDTTPQNTKIQIHIMRICWLPRFDSPTSYATQVQVSNRVTWWIYIYVIHLHHFVESLSLCDYIKNLSEKSCINWWMDHQPLMMTVLHLTVFGSSNMWFWDYKTNPS